MRTKSVALSLAVIMSLQTVAMANADRTEGISQGAVQSAQAKISAIQAQIVVLDTALKNASDAVKKDADNSHQMLTVGLAAGGAAAAALTMLTASKVGGAGGDASIVMGVASLLATFGSALGGISESRAENQVDLKQLKTEMGRLNSATNRAFSATNDKKTIENLRMLNGNIMFVSLAINQFERRQDSTSAINLSSAITQLSGVSLFAFGTMLGNEKSLQIGLTLSALGNVISLANVITKPDAKALIEELDSSRESLKSLSEDLN